MAVVASLSSCASFFTGCDYSTGMSEHSQSQRYYYSAASASPSIRKTSTYLKSCSKSSSSSISTANHLQSSCSPVSRAEKFIHFQCRSATTEAPVSSSSDHRANKEQIIQLYQYLSSRGEIIEKELGRVTTRLAKSCPEELHKAIRYCTADDEGRHLASLCLAACELVGGDLHAALPMACSIEMWMAIILTVDDLPCMDNAKTRRGRAAAHVEFDDTTALLATQALLGLAFETVVDSTLVSMDKRLRLLKEFSLATQRLVYGQFDDVKKGERLETPEELNAKSSNKTSSFFELPLVAGAIIGGGAEEQIESLRRFGNYFGLMYQVNDDLSDATMTAEEMGKDARSDARNGKATYLTLLGAERSAQLRDEFANRAREALLQHFPAKNVKLLLGILEVTRRFGSIYKNSQLLSKT